MSQFTLSGNINATNQQIGNGNSMRISGQRIEINWDSLLQSISAIESRLEKEEDKKMLHQCCDLLRQKDKKGIKEFLNRNFRDFSMGVLSGMTASSFLELIKILL